MLHFTMKLYTLRQEVNLKIPTKASIMQPKLCKDRVQVLLKEKAPANQNLMTHLMKRK